MVVLVTGASGFIGAHLVRLLLAAGHRVIGIDAGTAPPGTFAAGQPDLVLLNGDVADAALIRAAVDAHHPDAVIHLAYLLPPASEAEPRRTLEVNLLGFDNILVAARDAGIRRVVWTSSMGVYGPADRYPDAPLDEDVPTYPGNLYGATKVMAEALARYYVTQHNLEVIGIRANLVYGPGRVRGLGEFKIWSRDLFENSVRGEPVALPCGDQALDWVYVLDVARSLVLALDCPMPEHLIFNVLGDRRTVRDAASIVGGILPDAAISVEPGLLPPQRRPPLFSGERAAQELGYTPEYSLEAGAHAFIAALRAAQQEAA